MKIPMQYVNDADGNVQAVQISVQEWKKLGAKVRRYEQMLKLREDLTEVFAQVEHMRQGKLPKLTLKEVLDDL